MQDKYYVGAYWGPRKETALECARRAEFFLHRLARCDPSFAQWYRGDVEPPEDFQATLSIRRWRTWKSSC
ncbi:Imm52 family immunity protein [Archangium lansingense]|uniref:Imm52 family immunity protein n=1 Tax=Archangium lansingense TaxID=2995310 RepID=UPI003B818D9D